VCESRNLIMGLWKLKFHFCGEKALVRCPDTVTRQQISETLCSLLNRLSWMKAINAVTQSGVPWSESFGNESKLTSKFYLLFEFVSSCFEAVEALRHKTVGPGSVFWWGPWKYSGDLILLPAFSSPKFHSASNRNEYQVISLEVNCGLTTRLSLLCRMST
jgi:hypothetical protein